MRPVRTVAGGAALIALIIGACGPGASSQPPSATGSQTPSATSSSQASPTQSAGTSATPGSTTPSGSPAGDTIASTLIFGGPPECPERPFCLIGLQETYGLQFAEFQALDTGGPITVEALANDEVQVALMFTTDPTIQARDFMILEDDRNLQRADNLVPVVTTQVLEDHPEIGDLLNSVTATLSQDALIQLNARSTVDLEDAQDIAADWLSEQGLLEGADPTVGEGAEVVVGRTNFYEQDILSELYAQMLEANGFTVPRQDASGSREVVFPALADGQINVVPEYAATALEFVNGGAGEATADAEETTELLRAALEDQGLTALEPAEAANQNAIVVTQATADEYSLTTISDLGNPAP